MRNPVTDVVTATAPRVKLTATYGSDPARILRIVASASLPAPATQVPRPDAVPAQPPRSPAAQPGAVAAGVGPGGSSYTGKGFDACAAPSQTVMSAWRSDSPYQAVGIYLGGSERACAQPNLTAGWVSTESSAGWRFIPLWVGPQAEFSQLTSPASQAVSNAEAAVAAAQQLGLGPGTPLYYDMESYTHSEQGESSVLTFLSTWTTELHALGYRSGVYSSSGAGVTDLVNNYTGYTMPDVIDDALWNGQANTGDPAIPAGDWAHHQRIHQYSGGVNQTYGGYELNVNQDYLDVDVSAQPDLAGGPAVYDPLSGNLEIYGTGTGGTLEQIAWNPSSGWSGWDNLGGSITGTPSAVYDPAARRLEVYVRGANGPLFEKYWSPAAGWSGWVNLGGSITGSPAASYDPVSGNVEVYATGADGTLEQIAWNPSSGWSGWDNLGGSITGDPSPVFDPINGHMEVYVRGANGPLFERYWSDAAGWSGWVDLGGSITGSPAASYDPLSGNLEVYATGADGTLEQIAWNPSSGWSGWLSLSGSIAGSPSPVYDPAGNSLDTYAIGAGGPLFQIYWSPSSGWSSWLDLYVGGKLTGSPDALYDTASGDLEVYAVTSTGALWQAYRNGSGWHSTSLGGSLAGL